MSYKLWLLVILGWVAMVSAATASVFILQNGNLAAALVTAASGVLIGIILIFTAVWKEHRVDAYINSNLDIVLT